MTLDPRVADTLLAAEVMLSEGNDEHDEHGDAARPAGVEGRVIALERKVYGELAYWETVELLEATRKAPLKIATFDC